MATWATSGCSNPMTLYSANFPDVATVEDRGTTYLYDRANGAAWVAADNDALREIRQ